MAIPGQVDNTVAGLYRVTADGVGQDVFCVDPYQSISFGGSYSGYTLYTDLNILKNIPVGVGSSVHHLDDDDLTQITQIWATYYDGLGALSGSSFLNESAAMQLAIWEIVCGDATQQVTASPSLTKGLCYVSSNDANDIAAAVRANAMLANPSYASIAGAHLAAYVSANQQDFIFVTITSPPAMDGGVTCAMLGLGLLGLTGVKRYGTRLRVGLLKDGERPRKSARRASGALSPPSRTAS